MLNTIIFDCDGVLLDESYEPLVRELRLCSKISPIKIEREIIKLEQRFYDSRKSAAFWSSLRRRFGPAFPAKRLVALYNKDRPLPTYFLTKRLAKRFTLVLLSNQITDRADYLRKKERFAHFQYVFFSNEIGLAKPHARAFRFVLSQLRKRADECLFIDDDGNNVSCGSKVGISCHPVQGIRGTRRETCISEYRSFG